MKFTTNAVVNALALSTITAGHCAAQETGQRADDAFDPVVADPVFPEGQGPRVLIDGGHNSFHTADGRYAAFALLMQRDGYVVSGTEAAVTDELLGRTDVYVIANPGSTAEWKLPTSSAFTSEEIASIVKWVRGGGSLWLIADHMPFPGATEDLAAEFGVIFHNGFATSGVGELGQIEFARENGLLADHPITRGRNESERIDSVVSFTGQAFRAVEPIEPLMTMPEGSRVLLPRVAWEFDETTPHIAATGMVQGAVKTFGEGRVAIFGEAAMFTAQMQGDNGRRRLIGLSHPDAEQNQQFALNVMHWLTGVLVESRELPEDDAGDDDKGRSPLVPRGGDCNEPHRQGGKTGPGTADARQREHSGGKQGGGDVDQDDPHFALMRVQPDIIDTMPCRLADQQQHLYRRGVRGKDHEQQQHVEARQHRASKAAAASHSTCPA